MDAKEQSIDTALAAHTNDGSTKYAPCATAQETNGNKPYHAIGSNLLAKVDVPTARPCAIIGPDRVVPPQPTSDVYLKKAPVEPWPYTDNLYHPPPEYPHKPADYLPPRNISPRQTFQENMQRIMVPPTYVSMKNNEDRTLRNSKLMPPEAKFCDVPYTISPLNVEPKTTKSSDGLVPSSNSSYTQAVAPPGWPPNSVNVRPLRPYGAPEIYQYSEYPNYPGPRPISMIRPQRNAHEDIPQAYQDQFHPEANVRFKPYPSPKERPHQHLQPRYDYIANYPNPYHLHNPFPVHKYDLQKSMPPQPCPVYPPMTLKYLDRRMPTPNMERYQRSHNQQINFNPPFCNQNIPPTYGSVPGNCIPSRPYPYSPDPSTKPMMQNRLYFDSNNAHKYYPNPDMYVSDMNRPPTVKNNMLYQPYPPMQPLPPHLMYRKDAMKGFEHANHFRNFDYPGNVNQLPRLPLQFSPQTISISPDSNASNETAHVLSAQEDCGYVSQSSTASVRSLESGVNKMSNDLYRRATPQSNKLIQKKDSDISSKDKKCINVRQFLQMWNEGDEEGNDEGNNSKETVIPKGLSNNLNNTEPGNSQEQLYILDLVNVPNEELAKYEHIQKISKLPENIKGYSSIELLNQYEKLVEAPGMNHYTLNPPPHPKQKDLHAVRGNVVRQGIEALPRPISPLDVEAKISQSVIHKEVGCNFEIRPCSPQMLNVELATPVHNVLGERFIEKVVNPVASKSPMIHRVDETASKNSPKSASCKMFHNQYPSPNINDALKSNYCLQDLETNSGVGLASLPRLDNDIELNFPEINQQFINANKMEPIRDSSLRDLPVLNTDSVSNAHKSRNVMHNMPLTSENHNSGSESDKEFSKLSKYRKHKRNSSVASESHVNLQQNMAIHRTDSVIIKNPENSKVQENHINIHLNEIKSSSSDTINPLNVLVDSDRILNYVDQSFTSPIGDTAIDFSLNKSNDQITFNNCMSNLSDTIQGNIDTEKHMLIDNDSEKVYGENSLEQSKENSPPDECTVLHSNSPRQSNLMSTNSVLCDDFSNKQMNSSMLDHSQKVQSISQDKIHHETVITHSKPEEQHTGKHSSVDVLSQRTTLTDNESHAAKASFNNNIENHLLNNCTPEKDNISPQNCSLSLPDDAEHKINIGDATLCEMIEKPILNNSVVNEPADLHNSACRFINDTNIDNNLGIKKEITPTAVHISKLKFDHDTLHTENIKSLLPAEIPNGIFDDIKIPESNKEIKKGVFESEENKAKENNAMTIDNNKDAADLEDQLNSGNLTDVSREIDIAANSNNILKENLNSHNVNGEIETIEEKSNDDIEHLATELKFSKFLDIHKSNDSLEEKVDTMNITDIKKECKSKNIATIKPYNESAESKDFAVIIEKSECNDTKNKDIIFGEHPESQLTKVLNYEESTLKNDIIPIVQSTDNFDDSNSLNSITIYTKKDLKKSEDSIQSTIKNNVEPDNITRKINMEIEKEPVSKEALQGFTDAKYLEENEYVTMLNENNNSDSEKVNTTSEASDIENEFKSEVLTFNERTAQENDIGEIIKKDSLDKVHTSSNSTDTESQCKINKVLRLLTLEECSVTDYHIPMIVDKDIADKVSNSSKDIKLKNIVEGENISLFDENETRDIINICNQSIDTINECRLEKNPLNDKQFPDTIDSRISVDIKNKNECEISNTQAHKENEYENMSIVKNGFDEAGSDIDYANMCQSEIAKTFTYKKPKVENITSKSDYKLEHENFFRKELFSSRFQNLLLYNDGNSIQCNKTIEYEQGNEYCHNDIRNTVEKNTKNYENDSIASCNIKELSIEIDTYVSTENQSPQVFQLNRGSGKTKENSILPIKNKESECDERNEFVENITLQELIEEPDENEEEKTFIQLNMPINDNLFSSRKSSKKQFPTSRSRTLKRSLSESAADSVKEIYENNFMLSNKRTKVNEEILEESQMIAENLTNLIQTNRRNSISTIYNDESLSFCIVFDNDCVLTAENEDCQKICYTEIESGESLDCLTTISMEEEAVNSTELPNNYLTTTNIETEASNSELIEDVTCEEPCKYGNEFILHNMDDKSIEATWVEDVACMETVYSDDIAEDIVISAPSSPTNTATSEDETDDIFYEYNHVSENEHTNKVKHIYGNQMCDDDAQLVEKLYRTPQMDVNKTLIHRESRFHDEHNRYYDTESLEKVLSESYTCEPYPLHLIDTESPSLNKPKVNSKECVLSNNTCDYTLNENIEHLNIIPEQKLENNTDTAVDLNILPKTIEKTLSHPAESKKYNDSYTNHCESSCDMSPTKRKGEEQILYTISSSPEVTSTTPEEKGSGILLKIRSYKGTKISEVNDMSSSFNNSVYNLSASRPLLTKAAQKYIPPLKETIRDLKVKLHLPKHSLHKLQQLKKSKEEPKKNINHTKNNVKSLIHENIKKTKPKPKFEDVLKSIDEIQFKMHRDKNKKPKQSIPKVIIKKNENGAHYTSTKSKEKFNPDLTGRKWQPWVFLEKNKFIDKMALKQKFKAIYSHRKKTYVLAESFRKYKSISTSKFVISHPKSSDNLSTGKLKYTFKLKHN